MEGILPRSRAVGDFAGEGGGYGGFRGHQIHLDPPCRCGLRKLAVERHEAHAAGGWGRSPIPIQGQQAHSSSPRTGGQNIDSGPQLAAYVQHMPGSRGDRTYDRGGHGPALKHGGGFQQIVTERNGAGADADPGSQLWTPSELRTAPPCRHVGGGDQRVQRVQNHCVINPVIGPHRDRRRGGVKSASALCLKKARVTSSEGKLEVLAPSSVPILVMVGTLRTETGDAGAPHSITGPRRP